jgi:hypothetical protein
MEPMIETNANVYQPVVINIKNNTNILKCWQ